MAIHRASRDQFSAFLSDAKIANVDTQALSHAVAQWMTHHVSDNDLLVKKYLK
jgi:hemerythrin